MAHMIKFLIGGSPCTHWSIAKTKGRETTASGEGWELFKNFLIASKKFAPDFFLYENNKSVTKGIKGQISYELNAPLQYINSALVSAQNRERFYCHNFGDVPQPADRGIILQDILGADESGVAYKLADPKAIADRQKGECLRASYYKSGTRNFEKKITSGRGYQSVPVRIGTIESKGKNQAAYDSKPYRVYSPQGKSVALQGEAGGVGAKTGLYAVPYDVAMFQQPRGFNKGGIKYDKAPTLTANGSYEHNNLLIEPHTGKPCPIYKVVGGMVEIKGKAYPINLPDGYYTIRKLTVTECCRLQTLPDDYCRAVSATQAYKGLGNGWTAEVIIHLLSYALRGVSKNVPITVLSMYDGIGTGRYCFDMLGYRNISYYAYEIDKFAMKVAMSNYPDIIQCGDAYGVREAGWALGV